MKALRIALVLYYGAVVVLIVLCFVLPGTFWAMFVEPITWPTIKLREALAGNLPLWANVLWFLASALVNGVLWFAALMAVLKVVRVIRRSAVRGKTSP